MGSFHIELSQVEGDWVASVYWLAVLCYTYRGPSAFDVLQSANQRVNQCLSVQRKAA